MKRASVIGIAIMAMCMAVSVCYAGNTYVMPGAEQYVQGQGAGSFTSVQDALKKYGGGNMVGFGSVSGGGVLSAVQGAQMLKTLDDNAQLAHDYKAVGIGHVSGVGVLSAAQAAPLLAALEVGKQYLNQGYSSVFMGPRSGAGVVSADVAAKASNAFKYLKQQYPNYMCGPGS
ncbi:MAG TPA: hypothetical protein PK107_05105 [Candidatus Omnitrophota bacterium]|nr:hypothetical protein [Candidatus Omnitrophota bacterium]